MVKIFSGVLRKIQYPLLLLALCILAYGLLMPWTGFYADDWYIVWFKKIFGAADFTRFFAGDRPFLAWIYIITTSIFGDSRLGWQLFGLFARFLTGLAFWFTLRQTWPKEEHNIRWTVMLFLIFPGFSEQWEAVQYSHVLLLLAGYIFSIGLTVYAFRHPQRWWAAILPAWLWMTYSLFSVEYYLGLEVLRILLLYSVVNEEKTQLKKRYGLAFKLWMPFAISLAGFLIWRVFFWKSYMYQIQGVGSLTGRSLSGLLDFGRSVLVDLANASLVVWNNLWTLFNLSGTLVILVFGIIGLSAAILWVFRSQWTKSSSIPVESPPADHWSIQAMVFGLLVLLGSMVPFRAAGLPIDLVPPYDRFMVIFSVGSSLFIVGLASFFVFYPLRRYSILALLLCFSIGTQFQNANIYRRYWNNQVDFLWQLTWRIPGLEPGTMLITNRLPFKFYYSDFSLSAPLNLIYGGPITNRQVPYQFIFTDSRLDNSLKSIDLNQPVNIVERSYAFHGSTSQAVGFTYQSGECLKILDPKFVYLQYISVTDINPQETNLVTKPDLINLMAIGQLSNPGLIHTDENAHLLPENIFGPEPGHGWCYYFEKAELARQKGDWATVLALLSEAQEKGLKPTTDTEWYPFLAAYAMTGQWGKVQEMLPGLFRDNNYRNQLLCDFWKDTEQLSPGSINSSSDYNEIKSQLHCSP